MLDTPLNHRAEEGLNPREVEVRQVVELMNIGAEEVLIGRFDLYRGAARVEYKVQHGEDVPDAHLRAFRLMKEEVLGAWLKHARQIVQYHFIAMGQPVDETRLFQQQFPPQLWDQLRAYVRNLAKLPVWVNHPLSGSVFGGKQPVDFWREIFETGKAPTGQQVLSAPINIMKMTSRSPRVDGFQPASRPQADREGLAALQQVRIGAVVRPHATGDLERHVRAPAAPRLARRPARRL